MLETCSLMAAAAWSSRADGVVLKAPKLAGFPFTLGVASGDPAPHGVVLWTRLAPKPLEGGGMPQEAVVVAWQVCEDEQMTRVVREGTTVAKPEWAHSVHVEVEGLEPDRWYWYQFQCGTETSPKGRTRTMPAADAMPARLRLAAASCQNFEDGHYTAYEHMLAENVDLVLHLGDYIYEMAPRDGLARRHAGPQLDTLSDYRLRHAQYKTDAALRAMHAAAPWIVTWDDHEVRNNYAADTPNDAELSRGEFLGLRARAYQAYYEHLPLRRASLPRGPDMPIYRRLSFGRLAEFFVLDTRQYRSQRACGGSLYAQPCADVYSEKRSILGAAQRTWLLDGLVTTSATWKVLAQQVMMARVDQAYGPPVAVGMDQWPGYEADRRQILRHLRDRMVGGAVVLSGDIHTGWANELSCDFDPRDAAVVASEFVTTSISSSGGQVGSGPKVVARLQSENPFVKFFDARRGYICCHVTPREWRSDFRALNHVRLPAAGLKTPASFVLQSGRAMLERA